MPQVIIGALVKVGTAVVAAVGAAGVYGTATLAAIGGATIAVGTALANAAIKSLMPDLSMAQSDTDKSRQQTVRGTIEPQKIVYGEALVSGPVFFVGVAGTNNNTLYHAVALTGHEVEDITDIHFDNEVIADSFINQFAQVTAGSFGPTLDAPSEYICLIERKTGSSTQLSSSLLTPTFDAWTSDHKARGISYVVTQWKLTDSSQEVWDRLKPNNIKALVKGKKDIYDPRLEVGNGGTAGGNPDLAVYQQWTDNPALCAANYLTDTKHGLSVPVAKIDWAAVVTAADACDVSVVIPSGTQKRFTANGVLFAGDPHRANINKLLSAMNGSLIYSNGVYTIRAGVYEAPTESLDEDSLAGPITVRTSVERGDRFNTVRPIFIDPAQNHKSVEAPEVSLTAAVGRDNDEILTRDMQLSFTNSSYMAQRIAHKQIQMSDQQTVLTFPTNLSGLRVDVGDRVSVTVDDLNYSNKVFRCAGWSFSDTQDGVVNLTLLEDDASSYADPTAGEYSTRAPSGLITQGFRGVPDPQNLSATAGLKSIELNWTNPVNTSQFKEIVVYASPTSSWSNKVEIGRTMGTQFIHDASNSADAVAVGDTRYYWVRAVAYGTGTGSFVESDRNPDNDTSTIVATVGPNNPDYSEIVDDTPEQAPPTGLTLTETTVLGNDGSVLPAVRVSWTAPTANTYVSFYEVQFKQTSQGEIDYGQVTDAYNQTFDYGSVADATTLELNYGGVNEAISGAGTEFSSINVYGTSTVIAGMKELEEFTFKVQAVTLTGRVSGFITETLTLQGDQTAPAIPSSIVATGGIQQIKLDFELPSDSDLAYVEIFENIVDNLASSSLIVRTKSDQHTVTGLGNNVTRYYWLRSADRSGNLSGFSATFNATTQKVVLDDLGSDVIAELQAGDGFGIEPVSTLPATGTHVGQIVYRTTDSTLLVWTGSAWSEDIFTASSVDPGSITAASFASGVEPISAVTSLPSPTGYTGTSLVFLTTDKKLYRYDSSVPEFTAAVATGDLAGTIPPANFASDLRPVEVVSSLPSTDLTEGRVVILTTDNDKLYRYTGTQWTKAISAADMDDQISAGQIATNAVTAATIKAGAISTSKLDAGAVTAAKVDVDELFANTAVIGAIQTSAITAAAITAEIANVEFVESVNIATDAITAGKISAGEIDASKLNVTDLSAISANMGSITAGSISAGLITGDVATFANHALASSTTEAILETEKLVHTITAPANSTGLAHTNVIMMTIKLRIDADRLKEGNAMLVRVRKDSTFDGNQELAGAGTSLGEFFCGVQYDGLGSAVELIQSVTLVVADSATQTSAKNYFVTIMGTELTGSEPQSTNLGNSDGGTAITVGIR